MVLLSLYAGCGALDLGFERAGFEIGLAYDIREKSIASWNRNRPSPERGHVADLRRIRLADMDRNWGCKFVPSGVIGGPPCQSFSRANRSAKAHDPRTKLVRHFFSIALRLHRHRGPLDFILLENVPELERAEGGRILGQEIERLERYRFDVRTFVVDAAGHSVPQYRNRLFVIAFFKDGLAMSRWSPPVGTNERVTVGETIRMLPAPTYFSRDLQKEAIAVHPNHWCMVPKSRRFFDGTLVEGYSSARSFKTLAWDEPSITASYGHREVHVHPNGDRRLSVFEAMMIQGFPSDYVLEGTLSAQIDQVSEAVPPPLAEAVANTIRAALPRSEECLPTAAYAPSACNTLRS